MSSWTRRAVTGATAAVVCATSAVAVPGAATAAVSPDADVVINEVYGGGGNSGAVYSHDFIELVNTSDAAIDVSGWSVQYASAAGTSWGGVIPLTGSIEPGEYYVVQAASQNENVGQPLPVTPRVTNGGVNLAAANGNVALVDRQTSLTCAATACATDPAVVDLVGFGTGSAFAGSAAAPAPSATTSVSRDADSTNTADNAADLTAGTPSPGLAEPPPLPDPVVRTIAQIQGTGATSPDVGLPVIVRGVVTAAYPSGGYFGFVIQTPGTGGELGEDHEASHGLFVYQQSGAVTPETGQYVEVRGTVAEFNGLTQVVIPDGSGVDVVDEVVEAPAPITGLPWPRTDAERERIESMLFMPEGTYTVTNTYATNQFGEVGLAFGDLPLLQPTEIGEPVTGQPLQGEALAVELDNAARAVTLDDASSVNFLTAANSGLTPPYISLANPVRVGAAVTFPEPVIVDYRNNAWKLQPTFHLMAATPEEERPSFEDTRTDAPDAGRLGDGALQVAGFNVLNYFTTLGIENEACEPWTDRDGDGVTVRTGCPQRGAWDEAAFERQQSKIVDAVTVLDSDVVGLMEIENSLVVSGEADAAVADLVAALNAEAGEERWAYVASSDELPPASQMDVISNAIIYQPASVTPVGQMRVLADQSGAGEAYSNAREPLGQAFEPVDGGEPFFVVVNHFKSKGSGEGDNADQGDGQAASNLDRVRQATALVQWLDGVIADYEALTGDLDTFLVGDFNSYSREDPMRVMEDAGYVNVNLWMEDEGRDRKFSYSFSGLSGSLDHVLVSASMVAEGRLTGSDIWEINAPESIALEYSRYNYHGTLFHEAGPFRSSDHDPVIAAFDPRPSDDPGEPGEPGEPPSFSDVPATHPFYRSISWAAEQGITTGYADGTFRPSQRVSRQAMAAFVHRLHEGPGAAPACTEAPFADVPVDHPFCGEIAWMKDTGLSTGYADGTYRPSRGVSRQATAAFLYRQLTDGDAPACRTQPFDDVPTHHPFCGEIRWLAEAGIVDGYANSTFQPTRQVSRQAMTAFLHRVWERTTA